MSTTVTRTLAGTLTDSLGQVAVLPPQSVSVLTYDKPTATFVLSPTGQVAKGTTISGKVVATVDAALTVKSIAATLDGVAVTVAADGTFTFVA